SSGHKSRRQKLLAQILLTFPIPRTPGAESCFDIWCLKNGEKMMGRFHGRARGQWGEASPLQASRTKNDTSLPPFHYWHGLRGPRAAPQRLEIEPAHIAGILPRVFVLERMDFEMYRFRIAGTKLCEQFGLELRGRNLLDFWSAEDRFILKRKLATISQE